MATYIDDEGILRKEGKYPISEWVEKVRNKKVIRLKQGRHYDALSLSVAKYLSSLLRKRGYDRIRVEAFPERQQIQLRVIDDD